MPSGNGVSVGGRMIVGVSEAGSDGETVRLGVRDAGCPVSVIVIGEGDVFPVLHPTAVKVSNMTSSTIHNFHRRFRPNMSR